MVYKTREEIGFLLHANASYIDAVNSSKEDDYFSNTPESANFGSGKFRSVNDRKNHRDHGSPHLIAVYVLIFL